MKLNFRIYSDIKTMNCEKCGNEHDGSYGSGRFCSKICAKGFSGKKSKGSTRVYKNKNKPIEKICIECSSSFVVNYNKRLQECCSVSCAHKLRSKDPNYIKKLSIAGKKRCEDINERNRMRDIGRKGGFGKKGFTKNGNRYESSFEEKAFIFLENNNIKFEAHKSIPNSSKVSDIYLKDKDLWIELDGINREYRKKWLGENYDRWIEKLNIYKTNNLKFKVFLNIDSFITFCKKEII